MNLRRKATDQVAGFLDQGTSLTGELEFSGTLRIDGNFHGSIATSDCLIIGEHATVHADIKAGEVEVHGQVFGSVVCTRRMEISPTGRVRGMLKRRYSSSIPAPQWMVEHAWRLTNLRTSRK